MSREVLGGTALVPPRPPPETAPGRRRGTGAGTGAGTLQGRRAPRVPRARVVAVTALAGSLLAGLAVGWAGWRAWDEVRVADAAAHDARTSAVVTGRSRLSLGPRRVRLDLLVLVRSAGTVPVVVREAAPDEGPGVLPVVDVAPGRVVVPAGGSSTMVVTVDVPCGDSAELVPPTLATGEADAPGTGTLLPVTGALPAMVEACSGAESSRRPLVLASAAVDGEALAVRLRSPSGRTWRVVAVSAGGVDLLPPLTQPVSVDGAGRTVALQAPAGAHCPTAWLGSGIPQQLDVTVDVGDPVGLTVPVGLPLARWLLERVCPPGELAP